MARKQNTSESRDENNHLLESFDTPEAEEMYDGDIKLQTLQIDDISSQDLRNSLDEDFDDSNDNDTNSSDLREGNSTRQTDTLDDNHPSEADNTDLELQSPIPATRLTTVQRIKNVFHHFVPIKQTYERINNGLTTGRMQTNSPGRFIGRGTDGVFRNLMAKPDTESNRIDLENNPPSYEEAAADATPEYWESTVISPMYEDEVFVEGLPVGNVANFVWNGLVTVAFQFVGFILCYLLHTSHAAKQGSRAGLGITFVVYGYGMVPSNFGNSRKVPQRYEPNDPDSFDIHRSSPINNGGVTDTYQSNLNSGIEDPTKLEDSSAPYFAYGLIAFGLFITIKSFADYYRVKQMERVILSAPSQPSVTTTERTETTDNREIED